MNLNFQTLNDGHTNESTSEVIECFHYIYIIIYSYNLVMCVIVSCES